MRESIRDLYKQLIWTPRVINRQKLKSYSRFVVAGMGGSRLGGRLLSVALPEIDIISWNSYGLPDLKPKERKHSLVIASSYSGNTEETIDAFKTAVKRKIAVAVIATGGELLHLAQKSGAPHVELPDTGIQPRMSAGYNIKALLAIMGRNGLNRNMLTIAPKLKSSREMRIGKGLAEILRGKTPLIYASQANSALAEQWKITMNETGKTPAFWNVLPELNHNEMTGFMDRSLSRNFYFVFLEDAYDHPRIQKRMRVLKKLFSLRGIWTESVRFSDKNPFKKIFSSFLISNWTAYHLAVSRGYDPEAVPMVEEFKKLITPS